MGIPGTNGGITAARFAAILLSVCTVLVIASAADNGRQIRLDKAKPITAPIAAHLVGDSAQHLSGITSGPTIWLDKEKPLAVQFVGDPIAVKALGSSDAQPLAMASGDIDADGIDDLAVGYATSNGGVLVVHRGNLDAFAPQSQASFEAIGRGEFPPPFLSQAQAFVVPVRPDFIAVGDFMGHSFPDLAIAARGDSALYVYANDGSGHFNATQTLKLPGGVTALAAGQLGNSPTPRDLIVGISDSQQTSLAVYAGGPQGLVQGVKLPLQGPASNILFGNLGDAGTDVVFLAGGQIQILRSSNMQLVAVTLPVSVSALALGSFISDRNSESQMAVLAPDGSIHFVVREEFDPRPFSIEELKALRQARRLGQVPPFVPLRSFPSNGWRIVESLSGAAAIDSSQTPVLFRARVSNLATDDVIVLNGFSGQLAVVSHPDLKPGAQNFLGAQISLRPYHGSPVGAVSRRVNVDGRPGVIALHRSEVAPSLIMPIPDPTYFVNKTSDPTPTSPIANACNNTSFTDLSSSCSLREAILKANGDTIMLQAGTTYSLTIGRGASQNYSGNTGALYMNRSATIVGGNQNTTIIQWGTPVTGSKDMIMAVNEDIAAFTSATGSLSNLTIQGGSNSGTVLGTDGDGGCMEFDSGGTNAATATATLTLTNVTIQNCATNDGNGGGLAAFNTNNGVGMPTIINSIFQNNSAKQITGGNTGTGGGIWIADPQRMSMTNSQVLTNLATNSGGSNAGAGGGITLTSNTSNSRQTVIHSSTISGNHAAGLGGGLNITTNALIDQGTIILNNQGGTASIANLQNGGGIYMHPSTLGCPAACTDSVTLTKVTIAGNSATGNGGGISNGNISGGTAPTAGNLTMTFSRLAANTGAGSTANIYNNGTTISATDDWWGTNAPSTTISTINGGTTTFDPFIVLTHTASPNKIRINQSTALTADMSKDNHGSGAALSGNLSQIIGIPITFNNAVDGSISGAQTAIQSNAMATATFNAGGVAGGGKADAVVDQATVTASIIVLQPPSITKAFSPTVISVAGTSTLTFQITNPNVATINASFTDDFTSGGTVSGLVVAATPGVVNGCGGSVTANAGATSISFLNAALPVSASPCTITVNVTGASDGIKANSVTIDSTDAGNGNTATASPSLTVINPPTISKVFGSSTIPLNGSTNLTFTITNPNSNAASVLNGISFTDTLPNAAPGTLVVANPSGLTNTCSTTPTATAGSGSISLTGASLAAGASCTISVNVQGTVAGLAPNSVTVSDTVAGTGNTSSTSLTVIAPPTISKSFSPKSISLNGSNSILSFTLTNPNTASALSGIAFSDTFPSGLKLTSTTVTGSCGSGTITATINNPPGSPSTVSLSGGTLTASPGAGSSCTFSVSVIGIVAGMQVNTTSTVSSIEGGTGGTATDTITVVAPPVVAKAFSPTSIFLNSTTTLTITISNPAVNTVALSPVTLNDILPTGLTVASAIVSDPCGLGSGILHTTAPTTIQIGGVTIPANGQCVVNVTVTGATAGQYTNTTGTVSSGNGGSGNTASATLTVVAPPVVAKAFNPATIPVHGTTTLTITISNPAVNNVALSPVTLNDILPTGLTVASGITSDPCGLGSGILHTTAPTTIQIGGVTIPANGQCVVNVTVTGATAGQYTNTTGTVSSGNGGSGNTASANLTVVGPPTISKAFNPTSIPKNGTSTITFTISNPSVSGDLSGVAFSDTLPASGGSGSATLLVSGTPNVSNTCGGTVTATAGTGMISLSGASVAHNTSCTLSVDVTGTVEGDANNTTGAISSTEGGTGTASNTATLKVIAPPTISKAFGATNITLNGTTTLVFTITNPASNTSAENGIAFSDTLTNGLQVASTPGVTNSCGGTVTAAANSTSISLTGGSIATPGATCTIVVNVTGTQSGTVTNTTGAVSSTNGGTGVTSNTAMLIVASPATVTKTFAAAKIPLNGTTLLTITITNPNSNVSLTGLSFTDSLPAGLTVASTPNLNDTCGGTATATTGSGTVSLSGGTVASSASCAVSVNVQGTTAGDKNNSVQVSSTEGGTSTTASATVTVVVPPTISKAFNPTSIARNGTSTITFTISNPNNPGTPSNGDLTGVAFSDTLPVSGGSGSATLVISSTPNVSNTCGGTVTATAGSGVISLSGASVAHNTSCTLSVDVKGTVEGDANNTTGAISSTEGGTGTTSNTATLKVVAPPTLSKAFGAGRITLNGTTTLTFTITNPASNTSAENGIAFSDTLTNGLQVASTPGVTNSCGGTVTAAANSTSINLVGGSIATPGATCTIVVNVTGTQSGTVTNTTGAVSSTNGGTGATSNTATLTVGQAPSITQSFNPTQIAVNGISTLTFNIANPNTNVPFTGVAFTDNLPAGLVVASTPNLSNTCGGAGTATAGSGVVSLSGGALASSASCTVSVSVRGTSAGVLNNSVTVSSNEGGTGNTSSASITVVAPPTIAKNFGAASIAVGGTTSLTFNITNPNSTVTLTNIAFGDSLPTGLSTAPLGVIGSFCGGTVQTGKISGVFFVSLSGGTLPANGSCSFSVNVTGVTAGHQVNTTGAISATESGNGSTATASIDVFAPPSIAKSFTPNVIAPGTSSALAFTINNPAANPGALTGIGFTDTLPANLVLATPNGLSGSCGGGTITATAGSGTVSLSGATLAAGASCTFSVNVTAPIGIYNNTTSAVTSTNGGNGNSATATLSVASVTVAPTALPGGTYGSVYPNQTITASGGTAPYTFAVTAGALPGGLSLSSSGVVSGTPSAAGTFNFTVTATDANSFKGSQAYTVVIAQATQTITFTTTPPATPMVTGTYTVGATASSGLTVALSIDATSTIGACTISGNLVAFTGVGTCIVDANQAGNANYTAAPQVQQTLLIGKKTTTMTLTATPNPVNTGTPVTLVATVVGDPPTGTVSFADNGVTLACSPVPLVVGATSSTATCSTSFTTAGTHTIIATYSGDPAFAQATATLAATVYLPAVPAPVLDRWAMLLLCGLLGAVVVVRSRRI